MIEKIRVESFKSLVQLELELGRVNIFVGANGSGKSNILEAIGILGARPAAAWTTNPCFAAACGRGYRRSTNRPSRTTASRLT